MSNTSLKNNNIELNEILEQINTLESQKPTKPTQEKIFNIIENGIYKITPDSGQAFSKVIINTNVTSSVLIPHICGTLERVQSPFLIEIKDYAFYNCVSLSQVDLLNCNYIYYSAFQNCSSLTSLILRYPRVCTLYGASTVFTNTPITDSSITGSFGSIYVPASLVDAYKSATNWTIYADRIAAIQE